jgi:ATP-dependent Lon protease
MKEITVFYTLSNKKATADWLAQQQHSNTALALLPPRKECNGKVTSDLWAHYSHTIPVISERDDNVIINADLIPGNDPVDIHIRIKTNPVLSVDLEIQEHQPPWSSEKVYLDINLLLRDIQEAIHTNITNPLNTFSISNTILGIALDLQKQTPLNSNDQIVNQKTLELTKLLFEYEAQINSVRFTVEKELGQAHTSVWNKNKPLMVNCLHLLYALAISVAEKPAKIMIADALSNEVIASLETFKKECMARNTLIEQKSPGEPFLAYEWARSIKEHALKYSPELITEGAFKIVLSTAIIVDYQHQHNPKSTLNWSFYSVYHFLSNQEQRLIAISAIGPEYLIDKAHPLTQAVEYLEHGAYELQGANESIDGQNALLMFRNYFAWSQALSEGLSDQAVVLFENKDLNDTWNKIKNTESAKKYESTYTALKTSGTHRYFAQLPNQWSLSEIYKKFPNFNEVTAWIEKQLRLCDFQDYPIIKIPPVLLLGNPGLGKTRYINALTQKLNIAVYDIPMSSTTAGFVLSGSDITWQSAKPGKIADALIHKQCINPVFALDELDKCAASDRHDPLGPLYQLLEKHTAKKYMDEFVQIPMDTSHINWFATANNINAIPEPILSRFRMFVIKELTKEESIEIAKSVYHDIIENNYWGPAFEEQLRQDVIEQIDARTARELHFMLLEACANATTKGVKPLYISIDDLPTKRKQQKLGFTNS